MLKIVEKCGRICYYNSRRDDVDKLFYKSNKKQLRFVKKRKEVP